MTDRLTYRGFDVQDHGYGCWAYFRKEWDLGDPCGTATCFDDACQQIDEWHLDQEEWWEKPEPIEPDEFDDDFNNDITEGEKIDA
jgi:hypothetical protein